MSRTQLIQPRVATKATLTFAIVASQYNPSYVQSLVDHAYLELNTLEPDARITLVQMPGSFEIPLAVKTLAAQHKFNAIIALGLLLQGKTPHALLIAESITSALMDIALEFSLPIIHEVLLLDNEQQAQERCLETPHNRGTEAARAAVAAARTLRELITA